MTADHAGQTGGEPIDWAADCPPDCPTCRPVLLAGQAAREAAVETEWLHPDTIRDQRTAGWPDMHPEDNCHHCGAPNPTWVADTDLWRAATGAQADEGGILCPGCFTALYERVTGRAALIWRVSIYGGRDAPQPTAPGQVCEGYEPEPGTVSDGAARVQSDGAAPGQVMCDADDGRPATVAGLLFDGERNVPANYCDYCADLCQRHSDFQPTGTPGQEQP